MAFVAMEKCIGEFIAFKINMEYIRYILWHHLVQPIIFAGVLPASLHAQPHCSHEIIAFAGLLLSRAHCLPRLVTIAGSYSFCYCCKIIIEINENA